MCGEKQHELLDLLLIAPMVDKASHGHDKRGTIDAGHNEAVPGRFVLLIRGCWSLAILPFT
jgi:hypothetical protein